MKIFKLTIFNYLFVNNKRYKELTQALNKLAITRIQRAANHVSKGESHLAEKAFDTVAKIKGEKWAQDMLMMNNIFLSKKEYWNPDSEIVLQLLQDKINGYNI